LQLQPLNPALTLEALTRDIAARDHRDSTRAVAPLLAAPDAVVIDTTGLDIAQVLERVRAAVRHCHLAPLRQSP
jgi:cytidylate kinase